MRNFNLRVAAAVTLSAMVVTAASAAVYSPQQQLPAARIEAFKANPAQLLQQYPNGGAGLISSVRDQCASDPSTLPFLVGLFKTADPKTQVPGIAAGLAQCARIASKADQAYADEIQKAIAGTNNAQVIAAYQAATGDVAIAATGGGGAGGGGTGAGGQTGTSGIVFGGPNTGAQSFGGLHYTTMTSGTSSGSVGGTTVSVSPRR